MTLSRSTHVDHPTRDRLAGRYRLEEPLGYGGMGAVHRAHDELLDRPVAVKLLDHASPEQAGVSVAEARAAARLNHPGIVQVFDAGADHGTSYIVMELVPGRSLRDILRERGPLAPREAIVLAMQLADALDAAHRTGLVHCDVKPGNVIVTPTGHVKLVDFGIARAAAAACSAPTGETRASASYVAPEQLCSQPVDGRADVYALGAVLYEMLLGQPPFVGSDPNAVAAERLFRDPRPLRALDSGISAGLQGVVMCALARARDERYAGAAQMRDALREELARAQGHADAETRVLVPPPKQASAVVHPQHGREHAGPHRIPPVLRRWQPYRHVLVIAASAIVICTLVLVGWSVSGRPSFGQRPLAPALVGHGLSELTPVLEQAGIAPADVVVTTRAVGQPYVGLVVDQQPQPGQPLDRTNTLQIAVGVPE
ncbi:MAG: serine/threonine protein kinase [Chloroflexi bacterium]|nr:serine/threonine protein kinase [Chloroflexota bacterium]